MTPPEVPEMCQKCIWGSGAILTYITWTLIIGGWTILLWFVKKNFVDMGKRFDKIEEKQDKQQKLYYDCQKTLPTVFATKPTLSDLIKRVNDIEKKQARLMGDVDRCLESHRGCIETKKQ